MSLEKNEIAYSKKNKREITTFFGHELIYDYINGTLDVERRKAVEEFMQKSKTADEDYNKILKGIEYADQLGHTIVAQPIIEQISEPPTYLSELLKKTNFDRWPIGVKWGLEALIVVSVIAVFMIILPWDKAMKLAIIPNKKEIVLAEVTHEQKVGDPEKLKELEKTEPAQFEDEVVKKEEPQQVVAQTEAEKTKPKTEPDKAQLSTNVAAVKSLPAQESKKMQAAKNSEGFLYRGTLYVINLQAVSARIREKIVEFGGRKAGDVELGWKKTPTSEYYHFTIPEAKYEELNKFLADYGKIKLVKEKHTRLMPDGIIRLIITVEESKK